MNSFRYELGIAARSLARSPGFTAVAILTLALGIGANTAIFSIVNAVLLKPLDFPEPERLVRVHETKEGTRETASPPNFVDWRRENTVFEDMGAYTRTAVALTGVGDAKRIAGAVVTAGFFSVLETPPTLGRVISKLDTEAGRDRVVVLSHGLWQRQFGADPEIAGRTVQLEGRDYTVIGVMPPGLQYPVGGELWIPLGFSAGELATQRGAHYLDVIARLAPGRTVEEASAEMAAIAGILEARHPDTNTGRSAAAIALREALVGDARPGLLILLAAVGLVLLIACANVANLLLVRTAARKRELAVRSALGAGRRRLVRHVLTESMLLGAVGGAAGLALAVLGHQFLLAVPVEGMPRLEETELDAAVLAFTAVISILTGFLFGLFPAVNAALDGNLTGALKSGGPTSTADRAGSRIRGFLVVAETALAVLLLSGAGLLLKSFVELQRVDPGFNPASVLAFDLPLPTARYPEPRHSRAFFAELTERIEALPGVESAAGVFGLPLSGFNYTISVETLDGRPAYAKPGEERYVQVRVVTPDYFRTMQISLLEGRVIAAADRAGTRPVVVVNESAAALLWPGGHPLGRSFELGTTLGVGNGRLGGEVVGVVSDIRHAGPAAQALPEIFVGHDQFPVDFMSVVVRSSVPPQTLIAAIREQVRELDSGLPLDDVRTMEERLAAAVAQPRFYMLLLSIFASAAILLASIGIYGVLSFAVRARSNEIGIRRALGASVGDVIRMVLAHAMTLVLGGLAAGLAATLVLARALSRLLYGVSATDAATLASVAAILLGVALLASFVPAHRAARIDPSAALREE